VIRSRQRTSRSRSILVIGLAVLSVNVSWAEESVRFAVMGDSRGIGINSVNELVLTEIVDNVLQADPPVQFVVFLGDLVDGSEDPVILADQFQLWREIVGPWYESEMIGAKVYVVPGNWDLRGPNYASLWQKAFPELPDNGPEGEKKLTYSFDVGPCHLSVISTSSPPARHLVDLDWLADDLAPSNAPIKLVFGHEPAYPAMLHIGSSLDKYPEERDRFWEILVENGVQAYFCAHEHMYDHWIKNEVHQIITGGAGAAGLGPHYLIVEADERDVTVTVYAYTGEFNDQYRLSETANVPSEDRSGRDRSPLERIPCVSVFAFLLFGCVVGCRGLSHWRNGREQPASGILTSAPSVEYERL